MAAMFENFALAAERLSDCRGSYSDPRRAAQVFMHNEPRRAEPRRLIRPDANEIGASVSEKTREFSNADAIGRGLQLDERIVATQRDSIQSVWQDIDASGSIFSVRLFTYAVYK